MTSSDLSLLDRCIIFATQKHAGQVDKVGLPYILHPLRVMSDLSLVNSDQHCIAVLHDVFEDCEVTAFEIRKLNLPNNILDSLDAITHYENEPNIQYWRRILMDPTGDARIVKLADIRDNSSEFRMQGLPEVDRIRMSKKYQEALQVLNADQKT
jgi:(p)ppGpp synthase/HD superfamily hydrolase